MTTSVYEDDTFNDLIPQDPYVNIPDEMKNEKRWLVYRMEPRPDGKKNKIPYDPKTGHKTNNPQLGVSFAEARAAQKDYSGLGFYVEQPFIVVDIDGCVNPETGDVTEEATQIVREMNSFSELSPSGTGIHVWARGEKPGSACRRGIEIYSSRRFLTVTGVHVPGTPKEIRKVDITPIYNRMLAGDFQESPQKSVEVQQPIKAPIAEVQQSGTVVTSKMELLMHGEILSLKPFEIGDSHGNLVQYPSQSEADGALAVLLAFKHKGSAEDIDADFRVSSLYRSKWDRVDYRDGTIKSAIAFYKKSKDIEAPPNNPQTVSVEEDDEEIVDLETRLPDFPEFTGSLADLCDAMSPDIPYPFKFVTAVTHFGIIRSGLDTLAAEPHIQPRFYSALIAPPGRGKTAAINEVTKIFKSLSSKYQVFSSIDSGPALCDAFQDQVRAGIIKADGTDNLTEAVMAKILLSPDELTGIFEKSKITTSSRNSMLDELLKLFEGNTTGNRVRGMKIKIHIENAHLGLLGGATESGYAGMWTGTGGASTGLQSRITIVGIDDRKMPSMQRLPNLEKLIVATQKVSDQVRSPSYKFELDNEALSMYDAWWSKKDQSKPSETRIDGIVKRLMIVLARTNDVEKIGIDIVEQAAEFGDFVIACRERFNPLDSSTWCQSFENLIINTYQKHGEITSNACRRIIHPERRPGGAGPFLQAFKNLTAAGILRMVTKTQRSAVYKLSL